MATFRARSVSKGKASSRRARRTIGVLLAAPRVVSPPTDKLLAYLSAARRTIWVRKEAVEKVKRDFKATTAGRGKWRVRTEDACGPVADKFDVKIVDRVRLAGEPQPGDKRDFQDADCDLVIRAFDSGCMNQPGGGSVRSKREAFKTCALARGKTCTETFKKIGELRVWREDDCPEGKSTILHIQYTWRCD